MSRILAATAATAALVTATLAAAPAASAAPVTTGASAYASGAMTGSGSLAATLQLTGAVGGLLDGLISPIIADAVDPLVSALQGSANSAVNAVLGSSGSSAAGTPGQQGGTAPGAFPNDTFPNPCSASSSTQPCYSAANQSVGAAPLASVSASAVRGYTQQVPTSADATNPIFGRSQITGVNVSALAGITSLTNPVVSTGVIDAKANCPASGSSSASVSATSVSLLGGTVTLNVANGAITNLVVGGTSIASVAGLGTTTVGGVTVRSYGTAVRVDVSLSLGQLLAGLALSSSVITELTGDLTASSLTLSIVVGPNSTLTSKGAKAWGLGVGVDLSGSLTFNILGLVGATVAIPTGLSGGNYGNVLDLRLGYASCQAGTSSSGTSTPAVPPALI